MARERMYGFDLTCDSCGSYCDLDPIEVFDQNGAIPDTVKDPEKIQILTNFWLCGDCAEGYPEGAKDFFIKEYFTEDILYLCNHCNEFIPEDVRDEYDDTEVCLTCSPPIEESDNE
jgi:hypothetical protein